SVLCSEFFVPRSQSGSHQPYSSVQGSGPAISELLVHQQRGCERERLLQNDSRGGTGPTGGGRGSVHHVFAFVPGVLFRPLHPSAISAAHDKAGTEKRLVCAGSDASGPFAGRPE